MKLEVIVTGMVGAVGIGGLHAVLAQMASAETSAGTASWLSVAAQTTNSGLIGYLIIYGLPKMHEAMINERKTERDRFAAALEKANEAHIVILSRISEERQAERSDFISALKDQRQTHVVEQRETRAADALEKAELRKLFIDAIGAMRTAVHYARDVATAVVNRANTAIEVAKITGQTPQT